MKKFTKLFLILSLVAVLASSLFAVAAASSDSVTTFNQLYIGDYDQDSAQYSGMAHVVFGTVSNTEAEFGILIETQDNKTYKFPGKVISDSGKFGVAIYELPEGDYKAYAYSGSDDSRIVGEPAAFTANKATFTLSFDTSATSGIDTPADQIIAQGTNPDLPSVSIPADAPAGATLVWVDKNGDAFDFDAILTEDTIAYSKWKYVTYTYAHASTDSTGRAYVASNGGVDLTDGGSITMEFDITKTFNDWTNVNIYFTAFAWLPTAENAVSLTQTAYIGLGYNPAYGSTASQWQGWIDVTSGYSSSDITTASADNVAEILDAGYTIKTVYTAPTASSTGSMIISRKVTGEDDSTFVEIGNMLNIPYSPYAEGFVQDNVNLGFCINKVQGNSYSGAFTNFRVYGDDGVVLPVTTFGHPYFTQDMSNVSYTVSYDVSQVSTTAVSSETVEEGRVVTAPVVSTVATPTNGVLAWFDEDGNEFDFDTPIESNITLTARWIADETMYNKVYDINSLGSSAWFGSSTRTDLTGGKTLTMEFDILSSKIASANYNMSYVLKYYTTTADVNTSTTKALSYGTAQHFSQMYANYAYGSPWQTKYTANGLLTSGLTHGEGSNPVTYYAAGQTFKWVYKAPENVSDGTGATGYMKMYYKPIGADDSEYVLCGSLEGLVCTGTTSTSHVHPSSITNAVIATDLRNMASNDMVVSKVRIYGDDGVNLPWHWDTTTCEFADVTEDWGAETVNNTYSIGYTEDTTIVNGWFGSTYGVDLADDEVLTMEFKVDAAGNKWQNVFSGFSLIDIDPSSVTANPRNYSDGDRIAIDGNYAYSTTVYESRTAKIFGDSTATVGGTGIWDPYTDVVAGDWVRVQYKAYVDDTNKGYLRVYTKAGDDGEWILNVSAEGITVDMSENVRLVWYVYSSQGGLNFTHTISNYRMYTSNGQTIYKAASYGGNHAVTVTTAE